MMWVSCVWSVYRWLLPWRVVTTTLLVQSNGSNLFKKSTKTVAFIGLIRIKCAFLWIGKMCFSSVAMPNFLYRPPHTWCLKQMRWWNMKWRRSFVSMWCYVFAYIWHRFGNCETFSISSKAVTDLLGSVSFSQNHFFTAQRVNVEFWFYYTGVHSTNLYKDTNANIELLTELFTCAMYGATVVVMLPVLLYSSIEYYYMDSGKDAFFLYFFAWWPFDWRTPFGYLVAWSAQFAGITANVISSAPFFNIVLGSCWLFTVMIRDITNDVAAFNDIVQAPNRSHRMELTECFCDCIQNYSDAKQWVCRRCLLCL